MTIDPNWRTLLFDERQQKEIAFAELYERDFHHGTTGHNQLLLIARLALLLDVSIGARELPKPPAGGDWLLTFGKYNGKTLTEVLMRDPGYVEWLAREGRDPDIRAAAQALLEPAQDTVEDNAAPPDIPF
jgi:hypothetical protein